MVINVNLVIDLCSSETKNPKQDSVIHYWHHDFIDKISEFQIEWLIFAIRKW